MRVESAAGRRMSEAEFFLEVNHRRFAIVLRSPRILLERDGREFSLRRPEDDDEDGWQKLFDSLVADP